MHIFLYIYTHILYIHIFLYIYIHTHILGSPNQPKKRRVFRIFSEVLGAEGAELAKSRDGGEGHERPIGGGVAMAMAGYPSSSSSLQGGPPSSYNWSYNSSK